MDADLARLQQAIKGLIVEGRVGAPTVVRWYVRTSAVQHKTPDDLAGQLAVIAGDWLGGMPVSSNATRSGGELVTHSSFASGGVAILTAAIGPGEPANDLMIFGSKGAIYHGRTPEGSSA